MGSTKRNKQMNGTKGHNPIGDHQMHGTRDGSHQIGVIINQWNGLRNNPENQPKMSILLYCTEHSLSSTQNDYITLSSKLQRVIEYSEKIIRSTQNYHTASNSKSNRGTDYTASHNNRFSKLT